MRALKGGKGGLGSGQSFGTNPGFGKSFTVQKAASLDYKEGDRVHHDRFGDGTVKEIVDGARDYEVTVEFDTGGQRKMMACFAKLKKYKCSDIWQKIGKTEKKWDSKNNDSML